MRSSFAAFLFGFTLPFGRTSGRRIVFNGPDAIIAFYDENDNLRIQLGGPGAFASSVQFSTGESAEDVTGFIFAAGIGAGVSQTLALQLDSPGFASPGNDRARLILVSESPDETERPLASFNVERLQIVPDDLTSDTSLVMFNGTDEVFRVLGGEINQLTLDAAETDGAFIFAEVLGAGGTRNLALTLFSPTPSGQQALVVQLISESVDGTEPRPRLNVAAFSAGEAEASISGKMVPRSMVPPFSATANTAAHGDLVVTDMVLNNVPVIAGHTYRFWLRSQAAISAVASTWILTLNVNGVVTTRMHTVQNPAAAALTVGITAFADWIAPTTQATDDFAVGLDETTATAATFTLQGAAGVPRTFSVEDLGILA